MSDSHPSHIPVLAEECLEALAINPMGSYVDATFGRGGHAGMILSELGEEGHLYAFDQDETAVECANRLFQGDKRFTIIHDNFAHLLSRLSDLGADGVDGILMDLGVSSPQLDEADRGFSFMRDGPLDMRMDQSKGQTAYEYLMQVREGDLAEAIATYGEERFAKRIAKYIVAARKDSQLKDSTLSLVKIIEASGVRRDKHKHPATRTFQAIRMVVNQEAKVLEEGLRGALRSLRIGGRLVIISFQGLEHRIVKAFIREYRQKDGEYVLKQMGKAQSVGFLEKRRNIRARSAFVRVMERIK